MKWEQALDLHVDYARHTENPDRMIPEMTAFLKSYIGVAGRELHDAVDPRYARAVGSLLGMSIDRGPTYFLSRDVDELIYSAAEAMEHTPQPMRAWDLPTREGLLVLERPFLFRNYSNTSPDPTVVKHPVLEIRAIGWGPTGVRSNTDGNMDSRLMLQDRTGQAAPGKMFYLLAERSWVVRELLEGGDREAAFIAPLYLIDMLPWAFNVPWFETGTPKPGASDEEQEQMAVHGEWPEFFEPVDDGEAFFDRHFDDQEDEPELEVHAADDGRGSLNVDDQYSFGNVGDFDNGNKVRPGRSHIKPHVGEFRRFILSVGRFMEQRILTPEAMHPSRPGQKRWHRQFKHRPQGDAKVLVLRRIDYEAMHRYRPKSDRGEVGVVRRHMVRSHWRRFFLPGKKLPVGHPEAYVWRYVEAYERGEGVIGDWKHPVTTIVR